MVLAQYYSQPLVSLLSNLLLVPLSGLLVGLSAACLFSASFLPQLLPTLSAVFIPAADIFTGAAAFFAELPFPAVAAGTTGFIIAAAVPAVLAGTAGYFRSPVRKRRQVTAMLAGVFVLVLCLSAFRTETRLTVTFLDVGQGDAALIETPEGRVFLIDGGGYERYGQSVTGSTPISERVLLPALASKGISRLDGVFITHNHADHAQGAVELLSLMPAKAVYVNPGWDDTELAERLESSGTIFRRLVRGERFESGGVRFEILSPYDSGIREQDVRAAAATERLRAAQPIRRTEDLISNTSHWVGRNFFLYLIIIRINRTFNCNRTSGYGYSFVTGALQALAASASSIRTS